MEIENREIAISFDSDCYFELKRFSYRVRERRLKPLRWVGKILNLREKSSDVSWKDDVGYFKKINEIRAFAFCSYEKYVY